MNNLTTMTKFNGQELFHMHKLFNILFIVFLKDLKKN